MNSASARAMITSEEGEQNAFAPERKGESSHRVGALPYGGASWREKDVFVLV